MAALLEELEKATPGEFQGLIEREMTKKFGTFGHEKLSIVVTPHMMYWLTGLIVDGIVRRRNQWTEGGRKMDTSEKFSIASLVSDLRTVVGETLVAIADFKPRKKKK